TSNSIVPASMSGSDVNVLDEEIASAPPRNAPRASTTMSVVDGVSLAQTGIVATSLTTFVTIDTSSWSFPTFDPMSGRSMCGQELRFRPADVDHRVQADRLGDDAAPAGLEGAQDVRLRLGRRRRREQERVAKTHAGERRREVRHGLSPDGRFDQPVRLVGRDE